MENETTRRPVPQAIIRELNAFPFERIVELAAFAYSILKTAEEVSKDQPEASSRTITTAKFLSRRPGGPDGVLMSDCCVTNLSVEFGEDIGPGLPDPVPSQALQQLYRRLGWGDGVTLSTCTQC